jgi:hypothetical protein
LRDVKLPRAFLLREIDLSHGGAPAYSSIVLVGQTNFETAWWAKRGWDNFPGDFFVVGADAYHGAKSHLEYVFAHDSPALRRVLSYSLI